MLLQNLDHEPDNTRVSPSRKASINQFGLSIINSPRVRSHADSCLNNTYECDRFARLPEGLLIRRVAGWLLLVRDRFGRPC
jgi:hypothetical protein